MLLSRIFKFSKSKVYLQYGSIVKQIINTSMSDFLEVDGSALEGGGQILRNSISLSAILGIPVKVTKIRAGRSKPGLAMQHLKGIQLVGEMCQAEVKGANLGSTEVQFRPGKLRGGDYVADAVTAGSISLLLQVALPCAVLAPGPVSLELKGGTNADMAPQVDYMGLVFLQNLRRFGADFELTILRRGFFPKGGGMVRVLVNPVRQLRPVELTARGNVTSIQGISFVAGTLPLKVAHQMAEGAKLELRNEGPVTIDCYKEERDFAYHNGNCIILKCETSTGCVLGADGLGRRGVEASEVGRAAGAALRADLQSGACLDTHTQDQIIIYMALAAGKSVVRVGEVTLHTKTAIHIAELIAKVKFEIRPDGDQNLIECTGIGFTNDGVTV